MCRPAYTTGLISEIQREIMTRDVPEDTLKMIVEYIQDYPLVPSSKEPQTKMFVEPVSMKSVKIQPIDLCPSPVYNIPAGTMVTTDIMNECYGNLASFVYYSSFPGGTTIDPRTLIDIKAVAKKEQETMYTPEQKKADYLDYRLSDISCTKERALMKEFNLIDDESPATPQEIVDRILAGKFELPKDDEDREYWGSPFNHIKWRDPKAVRNQEGFDKASALQHKASQTVKDTITIGTPAEGLKALQDFEAAMFH